MDIKGSEIIRDKTIKEDLNEVGIRPGKLEEFIGQKKSLKI